MGKGIAQIQNKHSHSERGMTGWATRLRSSRLARGLACWLALQTAIAGPLAAAAAAVASWRRAARRCAARYAGRHRRGQCTARQAPP